MMDTTFTEVLVFVVFSFFNFGYAEIIYVNQSLTWDEARSHCTYRHGGRLLTVHTHDPVSEEISSCLPKDVNVWTGVYTKISPFWVTIEGCHSLRSGFPTMLQQYRYYNLSEPSLGECLNTCNPGDRERVALMNNLCICGNDVDFENLEKADDNRCTLSCDVYATCGSNDTFMVYRRSPFSRDNEDRYCVTGRCTVTLSVENRNCDESFRGICGSGLSNPYTGETETFHKAMGTCLENQGSFLIGQAINSFCGLSNILSTDFWIGLFRTEYYLYDEDQPYRILQIYNTENVTNRILTKYSDGQTSPFLCETDTDLITIGQDEILCSAITKATTTSTTTTTTTTITSSVPTTTLNESLPDIVDLRSSDMAILTLALSVGIGGVIFLAAGISLVLVVHYIRRKKRTQCCDEKMKIQHTFSNKAFVDDTSLYQNSDQFDERDSRESYIYQNSDQFDNEIISEETKNGKSNYINSSAIMSDSQANGKQQDTVDVYMDQDETAYDHLRKTDIRHVDRPNSDLYSHTNQHYTEDENAYNICNQSVIPQGFSEYYDVTQNYRN